jgi:hypothetical protein
MADDAQDSWLGVLGVNVDQIRNKVQGVVGDIQTKVEQGIDNVVQGATQLYHDAENAVTQTVQKVENAGGAVVDAVTKGVDAAKMKALGDQSGKPVPRPLEADCKPEHGYVPGPKNHLLCATHGHVIDTDQGMIIAESVASYAKQGLASAVSSLASKATASPSSDPNAANAEEDGKEKGGTDKDELTQKVVAELGKQLDAKIANEQTANKGIFDELNHLEDNRETNTVPPVPSFDDFEPRELQRKIKEERAAIPQLEQQRLDRAKAARADARAATEKLKKDATFVLFAGGAPAGAATVAAIVGRIALVGSGGPALALLLTLTAACIAELKVWSDYRDTLRALVDKAKADIRVINTNIEFSKQKIVAIEKTDPFVP